MMNKATLYFLLSIVFPGMGTQAYAEFRELGSINAPDAGNTEVTRLNVSHLGDEMSSGEFVDVFTFTLEDDAVVELTLTDVSDPNSSLSDVRDTITRLYEGEAEFETIPGDTGPPFPTFAGEQRFEALGDPVQSGDLALGTGTYSIFVNGFVPFQENGNGEYAVDISVSAVPIPAAGLLFLSSILGLGAIRAKRGKS